MNLVGGSKSEMEETESTAVGVTYKEVGKYFF